jgi:hypothetical protein
MTKSGDGSAPYCNNKRGDQTEGVIYENNMET